MNVRGPNYPVLDPIPPPPTTQDIRAILGVCKHSDPRACRRSIHHPNNSSTISRPTLNTILNLLRQHRRVNYKTSSRGALPRSPSPKPLSRRPTPRQERPLSTMDDTYLFLINPTLSRPTNGSIQLQDKIQSLRCKPCISDNTLRALWGAYQKRLVRHPKSTSWRWKDIQRPYPRGQVETERKRGQGQHKLVRHVEKERPR